VFFDAEERRERGDHVGLVAERREFDQPHAVGIAIELTARDVE
jgi:hypothetical protein